MNEQEDGDGEDVGVGHGREGPEEEAEDEPRACQDEDGLVAEAVGQSAPQSEADDVDELAEDGEPEHRRHAEVEALDEVDGEEGSGEVDGEAPPAEEGEEYQKMEDMIERWEEEAEMLLEACQSAKKALPQLKGGGGY